MRHKQTRTITEFIYTLTCNFQKLYLGNVNDYLGFEYEEETSVRYGCSATLHDEFWYFGGLDTTLRQVFRFCIKIRTHLGSIVPQEKNTGIFRLARSSIASWNDNLILNLIFMAGPVILSCIRNQRFYFALIMSTLKNVIRKYSLSLTVTTW